MSRIAVLVLAFLAGGVSASVALVYVANPLAGIAPARRSAPATSSRVESEGDRFRRECSSIVDAAGVTIARISVFTVLEEDVELMKLARAKEKWLPEQLTYLEREHPDRWAAAAREATSRARDEMVRSCILTRGSAGR
jgi:hypothetical protein